MNDRAKVLPLVYAAIDDVNPQLPEEQHIEKSPQTVLFGDGATLDSLGLVNLIVTIEQVVAESLELDVTLADERAFSSERSPFRTVSSLADYVGQRLGEVQGE